MKYPYTYHTENVPLECQAYSSLILKVQWPVGIKSGIEEKVCDVDIRAFILQNSKIHFCNEGKFSGMPNSTITSNLVESLSRDFHNPVFICHENVMPLQWFDRQPLRCSSSGTVPVNGLGELKLEEPEEELAENLVGIRNQYKIASFSIAFLIEAYCVKRYYRNTFSTREDIEYCMIERKMEMQGEAIAICYRRCMEPVCLSVVDQDV